MVRRNECSGANRPSWAAVRMRLRIFSTGLASAHAGAGLSLTRIRWPTDSGLPPSSSVSRLSGSPAAVPVCLATSG